MISALKERYKVNVGYSGHELGFLPTLAAVSLGANIIERHFTIDKSMIGFDHKISLEPQELNNMVKSIRDIEKMFGSDLKMISETEEITKNKYHVSIISKNNIPKGKKLEMDDVIFKNPGTGIPPKDIKKILGKKVLQEIKSDKLLKFSDFE